jgi:glycosyltransferase involved in cell wall biosynthesis
VRIGFVTQWFPPEPGTVVASAVADGLAARGHEVHVLTGFPNYPTGRLQDGYPLRPYRRDQRGTVTVHRAPLYPSHDRSAPRRMANYASFAAAATVVGWARVPRPDVWLVYSSPATAAVPALLSRWGRGVPTSLVIQDLWPDSVTQSGLVGGHVVEGIDRVLHTFCDWTYRRAAAVGVISPSMRSILQSRGVPDAKILDTPNWVADAHVATGSVGGGRSRLGLPDGRLFMYAGNVGELQGLDPLVEAFAQVPEASLVILGDGVARPRLEGLADRAGATNVRFLGSRPSDEIGTYIRASDVQVVSLRDTPLLRATMPSKTQSSLAFGKPVLAHAAGDVAALIGDNHVGAVAPPGDLEGTARAIRELASASNTQVSTMGERALALFHERFSAEAGLDRLETLLGMARAHGRKQ